MFAHRVEFRIDEARVEAVPGEDGAEFGDEPRDEGHGWSERDEYR